MWDKILKILEPKKIFNSIIIGTVFLILGYLFTDSNKNNSRSLKGELQNCKYILGWLEKNKFQDDITIEYPEKNLVYKETNIRIAKDNHVVLQYNHNDDIFICHLNIVEHKKELHGICQGKQNTGRIKLKFDKQYSRSKGFFEYDNILNKKILIFLNKRDYT